MTVPNLKLPAAETAYALGAATIALGALRLLNVGKVVRRISIGLVLAFFVISLLCWAYAGW